MRFKHILEDYLFIHERKMKFQMLSILMLCSVSLNAAPMQDIFPAWDSLSPVQQERLVFQLDKIDILSIEQQRALISQTSQPAGEISPFTDYVYQGSKENFLKGKQLLSEGKIGCLIVAGGQGSRLNVTGPKGLFPVTIIKQKSLFQLFAEKVAAASRQCNKELYMAIMTSPANHEETVQHFQDNDFFGLSRKQVFFFSQDEIPLLDANGHLFLETSEKIATGPDGNAASLKHFVEKGIWEQWNREGIRYLTYLHIDNPLADPFDAELVGFHHKEQCDAVIKCIIRKDPLEKIGILLKTDGKIGVVEYSEISQEERDARLDDGSFKHLCANIGLYSFSMDFIHVLAKEQYHKLPFHKAWKAVKYLTGDGQTIMAKEPMAWKFEKFIFDVLPYANGIKALLYPRESCFAPLKNAAGPDSLGEVQMALQAYDRELFFRITGTLPSLHHIFELDPQFYYPTEELLLRWKGRSIPEEPYILP
jgi:UDP-N-acetylglucosamine/UDP-N-acetylgalactosamine diphosphorylase